MRISTILVVKKTSIKECISAAKETLKPPIIVPWNPRDNNGGGRGGFRGRGRGRGGHRGGQKRHHENRGEYGGKRPHY